MENENEQNVRQDAMQNANEGEKQTTKHMPRPKAAQDGEKTQHSKKKVKITFLGGVGEIGKNMTAIEYGDEMIVVDAGLTFPGDDLPGVDLVVPDISYLVANKS